VESHGRKVMDIIKPTNKQVIARVTLGDEKDTRRAIAVAKRAFVTFGRTTKEERVSTLRRLHQVVSARIDDLTAPLGTQYPSKRSRLCGVVTENFSRRLR
jgi:aldehyde dehydrogenase (NAD+)